MLRLVAVTLVLSACVNKAMEIAAPAPEGGGTLTCKEIVEQCDTTCSDPLCLHACTNQGNAEGKDQHAALLECGQRNGCTDEDCMRASCPAEIETCMGGPVPPAEAPAAEPPAEAPGATAPTAP